MAPPADPPSPRPRRVGLPRGARTRILTATLVLLGASAVISVVAIDRILGARAGDRVDAALRQEVDEFRRLAAGRDPANGRPFGTNVERIFDVYLRRNVPGEGETIATYTPDGLYGTASGVRGGRARLVALEDRLAGLRTPLDGELDGPRGPIRFVAVPVTIRDTTLGAFVVTSDLGAEREEVDEAVEIAAGVIGGVLLLASALAWVVAGRVLTPLRDLRDTARAITESDLTRRIDVRGEDEIADLGRTFNAMLDRLETAFGTQRSFINDASHELRTPITIVRGHLELLGDDPGERRETLELVMDELDRMTRFVEDLLLLARAGRPDFLRRAPVDLDVLTEELRAKARGLAPRRWTEDGRGVGVLVVDRQRITQAVMGLAQNAVQHTAEDDEIALGSALAGGEVRLWVRDTGAGIPAADHERIFGRFARGSDGARRSGGAGLGLAIVRAIAEAHGGRVDLDSAPGRGSRFTLVLPLAENGEGALS